MTWVFNSQRVRGVAGVAPHTNFYVGRVMIGRIVMHGQPWHYKLEVPGCEPSEYDSFSDALKELHRLLNALPDEGHTVP